MNNILLFNGGGLNFFWYLGFINSIEKNYLENYKFYGYSGGIIAFILYLCNIKLEMIFDKFEKLSEFNLSYILNNLEKLLDDVLPENCHEICNDKLNIIYWEIRKGYKIKNKFKDKKELIEFASITSKLPFTLKNIKEIYNSFRMDPLYINFEKLGIEHDRILNISFTMDTNCSIFDSFYVYSDFKEYLKKYFSGYKFGLQNISYKDNFFDLIYKEK